MRFIPESWKAIEDEEIVVEQTGELRCRTVKVLKMPPRRSRHEEYEEQSSLQDDE
jgi:hypothetical protein